MGAPYYWAGKEPALQWFSAVPVRPQPAGHDDLVLYGDGLKLWEETYAPFNLVPRPGPSTGVQMTGWFRKKINTIADYKGLKMRIPGLGGKIVGRGRRHGRADAGRRDLHGARARRHRLDASGSARTTT